MGPRLSKWRTRKSLKPSHRSQSLLKLRLPIKRRVAVAVAAVAGAGAVVVARGSLAPDLPASHDRDRGRRGAVPALALARAKETAPAPAPASEIALDLVQGEEIVGLAVAELRSPKTKDSAGNATSETWTFAPTSITCKKSLASLALWRMCLCRRTHPASLEDSLSWPMRTLGTPK